VAAAYLDRVDGLAEEVLALGGRRGGESAFEGGAHVGNRCGVYARGRRVLGAPGELLGAGV
ncbi:MAG: hypothetical protein ACRDQ2_07410, partial [Gaiellales bacterium]